MKKLIYLLLISIVLCSCGNNNEFETDPSGMKFRFYIQNEDSIKPNPGDILVLNMCYKTEDDSVLFDSKELVGAPFRMKLNSPTETGGTIDDAFSMMHVGDSATFIIDAETFFLHTRGIEPPTTIKPGSKLIFDVKLKEIFSMEKFQESKKNNITRSEEQEMKALAFYLKNANIQEKPTESGLYYIETKKGKGKQPMEGSKVTIHYTGTFPAGNIFDSSLKRGIPFEFTLGNDEVIPGMEEGILKMKEGGQATLIIPSKIAYGAEAFQMIPPFSTLVFEIELLKVQ